MFIVALGGGIPSHAADSCTPLPAVIAALEGLPTQSPSDTNCGFRQKRRAALQDLLNRFPGDLFVEKRYVDSMYRRADKDKVIGEYKARYDRNPDDPTVAYLYGLALIGRQCRRSKSSSSL